MRKKIFTPEKYPEKCEYCLRGRLSPDGESVLCEKRGIVARDDSCRSYRYDALKRKPLKIKPVESADPEDFEL